MIRLLITSLLVLITTTSLLLNTTKASDRVASGSYYRDLVETPCFHDDSTKGRKITYQQNKSVKNTKVKQTFNPIFSEEAESNQIISFISANLEVELEPRQISELDGYLVIRFVVDTLGEIQDLRVAKSYNTWVDYAILGAMKDLPHFGKVFRNKKNRAIIKASQVVFSFGSYVNQNPSYGFSNDMIRNEIKEKVEEQKREHLAKMNAKKREWDDFTKVNGKLEYDIKRGLKQEANKLDRKDLENAITTPPVINPTITITQSKKD